MLFSFVLHFSNSSHWRIDVTFLLEDINVFLSDCTHHKNLRFAKPHSSPSDFAHIFHIAETQRQFVYSFKMFDHRFKAFTLLALVAGPSHSFTTPWSSRRTGIATRQSDLILSYSNEKGSALTESFGFLSLAELRHILSERGVHFRESMGKRELMEILRGSQSSNVESDFDTPLQSFYSQEQSLVSTFKTVSPSVANIKVEAGPQQQQQMGPPGMEMPSAGTGSGFLWDTMVRCI